MENTLLDEIRLNTNYQPLFDAITTNKEVVVQGPEGFKKSLMLMDLISKVTNFNNHEIALLCCKSYEQLKEKQKTLIETFGYSEKDVPIIGLSTSEVSKKYEKYWTNKEHPDTIYWNTKIVLMTQASLTKCSHLWGIRCEVKGGIERRKFIKTIFIDEFDCTMGVVPSLHYSWEKFTNKNYFDNPKNLKKDVFFNWLSSHYSPMDAVKLKASGKDAYDNFFLAYWLESARRECTRIIVATSELLPTTLLEKIGFTAFRLKYHDQEDVLKSHKVITASSPIINSYLFDRLNSKNLWNMFGFTTIISDRYKPEGTEVHVKVINHMSAKGTNALMGNKELLTIVSNVPNHAIQEVVDCLNFFTKSSTAFNFKMVKQLFYRDRICQAVGRVIGYRGMVKDVDRTYLLINSVILDDISSEIGDPQFQFYYTIERWDNFFTDAFRQLETSLKEDRRINKDKESESINSDKERFQNIIETKLNEFFYAETNSELTYDQINKIINDNEIIHYTGNLISPILVANHFSLKPHRTSRRDPGTKKPQTYVKVKGLGAK
jgi:hypothetical protein